MNISSVKSVMIDRALIQRLHVAHGDYLEEYFNGPNRRVLRVADARAFLGPVCLY
jgi:hypothetical protein